jgi:3-deoxy-D-manno-octulosonic-acid transferase
MRRLADLLYLIAGLIYLPVVLYQAVFQRKNRHGWRQRFGAVPSFDPARRRIWIHAVSLGEINATPALVAALQARLPDAEIVFSTTTDTGFARAVQHYGAERVFRFPVDFSVVVSRMLKRIHPSMIVLVELEVWYNLVRTATRSGIPVVVVNGRVTERSHRRLKRAGRLVRPMFADLAWVGAQDDAIAARFASLGVGPDRVDVTGSLKWDTAQVVDRIEGADAAARAVGIDGARAVLVCGSTGPGEEEQILDAYQNVIGARHEPIRVADTLRLVIVPRKPERFDDVAKLIKSRRYECVRRSEHQDGVIARPGKDGLPIVLVDTLGELRKFYSLAAVVFVGRTLVPLGGSDPMEVAGLAKPILLGPHFDNFDLPVRVLERASALRVVQGPIDLAKAITSLVDNPGLAANMGRKARDVVLANQGATERTAERIAECLSSRSSSLTQRELKRLPSAVTAD